MTEINKPVSWIIEAILMAADEPVTLADLHALIREEYHLTQADLVDEIKKMREFYSQHHGVELIEVASGYRFQAKQSMMSWLLEFFDQKPQKISRVMLETIAIIAYHQPITRGDIERLRGVSTQNLVVRQLLDRNWIKVVGSKDVPGRPELLGTTKVFLDYFNLQSLADLPEHTKLLSQDQIAVLTERDQA